MAGLFLLAVILYLLIEPARKGRAIRREIAGQWGAARAIRPVDPDVIREIAYYYDKKIATQPDRRAVDQNTWEDLDMDAVFQHLNHTQSAVGEEALYAMLHEIGAPSERLSRRRALIEAFSKNEAEHAELRRRLYRLGKRREQDASMYLFSAAMKKPNHAWLYNALAALPVAFLVAGIFHPPLLLGLIASFIANLIVHYRTQAAWGAEQAAVRRLVSVIDCARKIAALNREDIAPETEEIKRLLHELKGVSRWGALFLLERSNDLDIITEYLKIAFLTSINGLCGVAEQLSRNAEPMQRLYALIGELDAVIGLASFSAAHPEYHFPDFCAESAVTARDVRHPMVENAVPNSIHWAKSALITGSNASGKSTFTKALAVNAILAQSVCLCRAESFRLPRSKVISSMAIKDSILRGDSYFIAEIKSLKRALEAISDDLPTLLFIDEILRGTNTVERIASSAAMLKFLSGQNALALIATHDVELPRLMSPEYDNYHFTERITGEGMTFDYKLMDGPAVSRNAIALLHQMGFPGVVTETAESMAVDFDRNHLWRFPD